MIYGQRDPAPVAPRSCRVLSCSIIREVKQGTNIWNNTLFPLLPLGLFETVLNIGRGTTNLKQLYTRSDKV